MKNDHATFQTEYAKLPMSKKSILRKLAVEKLKEFECEEIGSSDVSNQIFSWWISYNTFDAILVDHWIDV